MVSTSSTQTNNVTNSLNGGELYPSDFIQKVLIEGIGKIHEEQPYEAFALMAIGVEFLGKCLNSDGIWNKYEPKQPKIDFEKAINNLNSFAKYREYLATYKIWDSLRNGFLHSFIPKETLSLSSKIEAANLTIENGKLNLRCEDFYLDFKLACEEVISKDFDDSNKMKKPFLSIPLD